MNKPFDIFWFGENGPNWIEAVDTLETARSHIDQLPQGSAGSYAVVDQRTGTRLSFASNSSVRKLSSGGQACRTARPKS
jgi:hypothetical protein